MGYSSGVQITFHASGLLLVYTVFRFSFPEFPLKKSKLKHSETF